jgi:hypothetical protein
MAPAEKWNVRMSVSCAAGTPSYGCASPGCACHANTGSSANARAMYAMTSACVTLAVGPNLPSP